jgi:O-antigen/teichoic acid export membrane protein
MSALGDRIARLPAPSRNFLSTLGGAVGATTTTNLLILGSTAVTGVVTARALGPAGRGQLTIVLLWSAVIHTVGSLGLPSSFSYHLARWPHDRAWLLGWFRRIGTRQAIAMTAASTAVLWWLHLRLHVPLLLTTEYTTWAAAATITLYGTAYAQGLDNFSRFNVIRMISAVMPAALITAGAAALRLTPAEAGAGYLIPAWSSAVLAMIWLRPRRDGQPAPPLSARGRRALWSYGWRSVLSLSGLMLNTSADQLTLGLLVPAGSLGLYSVGASASSPLPALIASFGMVGLPTVTPLTGTAKAAATWRILRRAACRLAVAAPALAVAIPWALPLLYGTRYAAAVVPAELLLLGTVFAALATVTDDLLRAHGLPGFVSITQGAGGILTVTGILVLGGRPLAAVSAVSSLGFAVACALALARLRLATRRPFTLPPGEADT